MTQGRDGISLAPVGARRLMGVARRLSVVVAAMFVIAALAGASYAQTNVKTKKDAHHHKGAVLLDSVTVTNYGAAFGGGYETFAAGRGPGDAPHLLVRGPNTLLGSGTGPAGVSISSADGHIAVSVPIDLLDLTGFGAAAGLSNGPGTGFAAIFSQGANKDSAPESLIGTRNVSFDNTGCMSPGVPFVCCTGVNAGTCQFNTSGVNTAQGLAFEDPFDGVNPGKDIVAIANTLPINFFSTQDFLDGTSGQSGGAACNAFGNSTCTGPGTPLPCCTSLGAGLCAGMVVGTIAEFDRAQLAPGFNDNVAPINNFPVCTLPAASIPPNNSSPPTTCPTGSLNNATIGGCLTFLLGPIALAYDSTGFLFAVNEAAVAMGGPGFVTVYAPGASGDAFPAAIIGLIAMTGTPPGTFVDPAKVTVFSPDSDFFDDIMLVTDVGDNSIKIFSPFTGFTGLFFTGTELGVIKGGSTKLKRPEGIAVNSADDAVYVVNNSSNTLEMFTDIESDEDGGDIAPTLIVQGRNTKLNFPVDVALPAFTPSEAGARSTP
jgi:hypothetical protein